MELPSRRVGYGYRPYGYYHRPFVRKVVVHRRYYPAYDQRPFVRKVVYRYPGYYRRPFVRKVVIRRHFGGGYGWRHRHWY